MDFLHKNLLDLQHSLFSTKGAILFTLGIGGAISIISLLNQIDFQNSIPQLIPIVIGIIWFAIFGSLAIKQFSECNKIQKRIKNSIH